MSVRWQRILAVAAAVLVLIGGAGYGVMRPKEYESHAALFLVPGTTDIGKASAVLDSLGSAGTVETYVELLASRDTLGRAGVHGIRLDVRAVPASRVIQLTARGPERRVRGALAAIVPVALQLPRLAHDPWRLNVLESPTAVKPGGLSLMMLIAVVLLAAVLAAVATFTILGALRRAAWVPERVPVFDPVAPGANGQVPADEHGLQRPVVR